VLLGASQIALGVVWRSVEHGKADQKDQLATEEKLQKQQFQLDYDKATAAFERFREEYSERMTLVREEIDEKVATFQLELEKEVSTKNAENAEQLREIKNRYEEATNEIARDGQEMTLELREDKIEQQTKLNEILKKEDAEFKDAASAYERETTKLNYVRQELEVLLDDIQKDLQTIEVKSSTGDKLKVPPDELAKLAYARVKLTVFLKEYRERMKITMPEWKHFAPELTGLIQEHRYKAFTPQRLEVETFQGKIAVPHFAVEEIKNSLSRIGAPPDLAASALQFTPTLATLADDERLWV
jgi:hypothetical protein